VPCGGRAARAVNDTETKSREVERQKGREIKKEKEERKRESRRGSSVGRSGKSAFQWSKGG